MPVDTCFAYPGVFGDVDDVLAGHNAVHRLHAEAR